MGKWTRLACGPVVMLALTTCSVKRTIFEGAPGDAAPSDDVALPSDDPPLIEDALLVAADSARDAAAPTDAPGVDTTTDAPFIDAPVDARAFDAPPPVLGTMDNPASTCAELRDVGMPSGVYWVRHPTNAIPPFRVYCEQQLEAGGWAMVVNSVRREDGTTTAFWQFGKDDRLKERGMLAPDQNYYNGALYVIGREYMDVFVDLQGNSAVAAVMTATGIDQVTMRFTEARFAGIGDVVVFNFQFAAGWSAWDSDNDDEGTQNCAVHYNNVAQHYRDCWAYNLGSDADGSLFDGGVGPHVKNSVLITLSLALQPNGGSYSQVKRIARFTRW
jgi:hypothetical protein